MSSLVDGPATYRYRVHCQWSGSTGVGYEHYERAHDAWTPPAATKVRLSADEAFGGERALPNPEQLVVLAAASCQLLSFLAVAARARIDVVAYDDHGEGAMRNDRPTRLDTITLRPTIWVAPAATVSRVEHLVEVAPANVSWPTRCALRST